VVLGSDEHAASLYVAHGVIPSPVPVRQLLGAAAEREAEDLMAQADAEDRDL